jgi:hypothetical protein
VCARSGKRVRTLPVIVLSSQPSFHCASLTSHALVQSAVPFYFSYVKSVIHQLLFGIEKPVAVLIIVDFMQVFFSLRFFVLSVSVVLHSRQLADPFTFDFISLVLI